MIKVRCIGSLFSQGYFSGEYYEVSKEFYEANENCFEEVKGKEIPVMQISDANPIPENKQVKAKDVKKK